MSARPVRQHHRRPLAVGLVLLLAVVLLLELAPVGAAADPAPTGGAGAILGPTPGSPLTKTELYSVVDHNTEHRKAALHMALRRAVARKAQVITLQEVCGVEVAKLRKRYADWTIGYQAQRKVPWCQKRGSASFRKRHPRYIGNVVIWTGGWYAETDNHVFDDQYRKGWRNGMACLSFVDTVRVRVCSVHTVAKFLPARRVQVRNRQIRQVRQITRSWITADDDLVIIGGDFNTSPVSPPMDNVYSLADGYFREAIEVPRGQKDCRCATPRTRYNRKIDYVFFSRNRFGPGDYRDMRVKRTASDHHMLLVRARVRLGYTVSVPTSR